MGSYIRPFQGCDMEAVRLHLTRFQKNRKNMVVARAYGPRLMLSENEEWANIGWTFGPHSRVTQTTKMKSEYVIPESFFNDVHPVWEQIAAIDEERVLFNPNAMYGRFENNTLGHIGWLWRAFADSMHYGRIRDDSFTMIPYKEQPDAYKERILWCRTCYGYKWKGPEIEHLMAVSMLGPTKLAQVAEAVNGGPERVWHQREKGQREVNVRVAMQPEDGNGPSQVGNRYRYPYRYESIPWDVYKHIAPCWDCEGTGRKDYGGKYHMYAHPDNHLIAISNTYIADSKRGTWHFWAEDLKCCDANSAPAYVSATGRELKGARVYQTRARKVSARKG